MIEKLILTIKKQYNKVVSRIINKINKRHNKLPKDVKYFDGSLYDAVYNSALKYPFNVAIEYEDRQITYKNLIKKINNCARALKSLGIKKGDKVTICMPNTPEEVIMFYAINEIGAVSNMIHPLSSERDIEYYLNKSNSKIMLCIDINYSKIKNIIDNTKLEKVIIANATKSMRLIMKFMYWLTKGRKIKVEENEKFIHWDHFLNKSQSYQEDPYEIVDSKDPAVILYSGGTTGKSKGVVISNYSFNAEALQGIYVEECLANSENTFLTFLPNFHAFGCGICTHLPLYHGLRVVLIAQFNAKKIKQYVRKYHFNILCGVPTFYDYMTKVKFKKDELSCLKLVVCGGDSISTELKEKVNNFLQEHGANTTIQVGYGLTETSGVVALSKRGIKESDVIGYPFPDVDFKIIDPDTEEELGINECGELIISGPNIMLEYLDEPEETKNTIFEYKNKKYVHTGDICYIDKLGLVHYKSRLKRMIITSGYNVYPSHVEDVIMEHSKVLNCTVIGIPDKNKGEVVKAFIVLKDNNDNNILTKNSIQKFLKQRLAKYEQPKEIKFIKEIPTTLLGKVAYKELEKMN